MKLSRGVDVQAGSLGLIGADRTGSAEPAGLSGLLRRRAEASRSTRAGPPVIFQRASGSDRSRSSRT